MTDLRILPKIELHNHLDCALSFDAVHAIDPSVSREDFESRFVAPRRCDSLARYLTYTFNFRNILQTEAALRIAVQDVFAQLQQDHVIYGELRFAPLVHTQLGLEPEEIVRTVADETSTQIAMTGIEACIILCTLRDFTPRQSMETANLVRQFAETTPVAALDIAGDEVAYPLTPHLPAFHTVRAAGLGITVHAGEAGGPDSVLEALDFTRTQRIGHGVRSIEDDELLQRLKAERIHLEMCPICNVQTNAVPSMDAHPVDTLYRQGISLGISTDTRGVTANSMTEEYEALQETFGWTVADFGRINRYALEAAFASDDVKEALVAQLDEAYPAP
jgi:adenosine deaminase